MLVDSEQRENQGALVLEMPQSIIPCSSARSVIALKTRLSLIPPRGTSNCCVPAIEFNKVAWGRIF